MGHEDANDDGSTQRYRQRRPPMGQERSLQLQSPVVDLLSPNHAVRIHRIPISYSTTPMTMTTTASTTTAPTTPPRFRPGSARPDRSCRSVVAHTIQAHTVDPTDARANRPAADNLHARSAGTSSATRATAIASSASAVRIQARNVRSLARLKRGSGSMPWSYTQRGNRRRVCCSPIAAHLHPVGRAAAAAYDRPTVMIGLAES